MDRVFYLTSGELAELLGVSKQTVFYYDKIGLLCPQQRAGNHYRYYSLQQAAELRLILTFRELGLSIEEIRAYLHVRTPEAYLQVLGEQQKRLQQEIERLSQMVDKLAGTRHQLGQAMSRKEPEIRLREMQEEKLLSLPCREQNKREYIYSLLKLYRMSRAAGEGFTQEIYCILPQEKLQAKDFEHVYGYAMPWEGQMAETEQLLLRPAGTYAVLYHRGTYGTLSPAYQAMAEWIEERGYEICGHAYEKSLFNTLTGEEHGLYINEIAIQVKRKEV